MRRLELLSLALQPSGETFHVGGKRAVERIVTLLLGRVREKLFAGFVGVNELLVVLGKFSAWDGRRSEES